MNKSTILKSLNTCIKVLEDNLDKDIYTWEDEKINSIVQDLLFNIECAQGSIQYFMRTPIIGHLEDTDYGKFELNVDGVNRIFSCGSNIEMYLYVPFEDKEVWCMGSIEVRKHNSNPIYYFLNDCGPNKDLEVGDLVRIR